LTDRQGLLPVRITPYFASLISTDNPEQPLRKCVIPILNEHILSKGEVADPLGEEKHSPLPNLVHRYPDRVAFPGDRFLFDLLPVLYAFPNGGQKPAIQLPQAQLCGIRPVIISENILRFVTC